MPTISDQSLQYAKAAPSDLEIFPAPGEIREVEQHMPRTEQRLGVGAVVG